MDKPMLKAGRSYHKYRVKRNEWPKVRGVCMNPVDHHMEEVTTSTLVSLRLVAEARLLDRRWV